MFRQIVLRSYILLLVLTVVLVSLPQGTLAQGETAHDLVNAINELRALHGLAPYTIDPLLMAYAQEHSEYQASIQSGTHQHSDGSLSKDIGLIENVAGGHEGVVTVTVVVYEIWIDWGHRNTLVGYATGEIGAGVALSENGQVYYTVEIRPGEAVAATVLSGKTVPYEPLTTSTPDEDGSIIHVVKYGETLWSIAQAYGVRVEDVRRLNGMAGDATVIQIGQKLLVRPADAVTLPASVEATSTLVETPPQNLQESPISTPTTTPSTTSLRSANGSTETPSRMPAPSSTNPVDVLNTAAGSNRMVAIILLAIVILLLPLVVFSFRGSGHRKISGK